MTGATCPARLPAPTRPKERPLPHRRAVAYYRTSSAANLGPDKDSRRRQREAVARHARAHGLDILAEFHDAAVSGGDPLSARPGFTALLAWAGAQGVDTILVESASRFARDLLVQETGHALLKAQGLTLIAVDDPDAFTADTPTARMVRQILGAVAEFEKASLVAKLQGARDRRSAALGRRCEGRRPVPAAVVATARRLAAGRSLRQVAAALAAEGHLAPSGRPYRAESVRRMLAQAGPGKDRAQDGHRRAAPAGDPSRPAGRVGRPASGSGPG